LNGSIDVTAMMSKPTSVVAESAIIPTPGNYIASRLQTLIEWQFISAEKSRLE